jgi:hypothetical protein
MSSVSVTVKKIITPFLEEQEKVQFVGNTEVNTTRVVRPLLPEEVSRNESDLVFGGVEFKQNSADAMRELLKESARVNGTRSPEMRFSDDSVEWVLDDSVVLAVYFKSDCVEIFQFGRPLSLDAIGSGTQAKVGSEDNAGGFGDGLKTGVLAFLRRSCGASFEFRGYDSSGKKLVWNWESKVCPGFNEKHLVACISEEEDEDEPPELPTMVTRISFAPELRELVHRCFVTSLSRFSWLLYDYSESHRCISAKGFGAWCKASQFSCPDVTIAGNALRLPSGPLVEIGGIFYPMQSKDAAPSHFVMRVEGRGLPGDQFQVFNNQLREPNQSRLEHVFSRQFDAFFTRSALREKLTDAFMPLLEGGRSFVIKGNPGSLVRWLLYSCESKKRIRDMLLFRHLSPEEWPYDEREEKAARKEVHRLVASSVLVNHSTEAKARYLQWIADDGGVVVIDTSVANSHVFQIDSIDYMEERASEKAREIARTTSNSKCVNIDDDYRPAVDYISGKGVKVVRVAIEPPRGIKPHSFRSKNTIVYHQTGIDGPRTVKELNVHFRTTEAESNRSTMFLLHFMSRRAEVLCLESRVKLAIRLAKEDAPYDIGEEPEKEKKRKATLTDSDSDSEDTAEKMAKRLKERLKAKQQKKETKPKERVVRPKAERAEKPSSGRRKLSGGGGGGSLGPHMPDLPPQNCLEQEWSDNLGVFVPEDAMLDCPDELPSRLELFEEAVTLVREAVNTGRCQIYGSWSPDADWGGLHYSEDGLCLINLALVKSKHDMIVTVCHELSHEHARAHDVAFVNELQTTIGQVFAHMLA